MEEDLVARIARGDSTAEERFAQIFEPRIRTMAAVRTRNPETARDLCQEVLLSAIEALRKGSLREPAKLGAFVHGIGRNIINNYFRTRDPEAVREPTESDLVANSEIPYAEEQGRRRLVRSEIDRLDPIDAQILLMTLVEGRKPGEISAALGISGDVVRQRKLRAIKKIAQRMSQSAHEGPHEK